jgi:antitoxin PrlF
MRVPSPVIVATSSLPRHYRADCLYDPMVHRPTLEAGIMATTTKTEDLIAHLEATTMTVRIGEGLELPEKIRRAAGLAEGDTVYINIEDEGEAGFHVRIRKIDPDQAWYWTPRWQAGEREVDEDRAAGRVYHFNSDEEFLATLKQWSDDADV